MTCVLAPVSQLWGSATVVDSDPIDELVRDALYVPFRSGHHHDEDPLWGIYDRDGMLVEGAAFRREHRLIGQSPHRSIARSDRETCNEDLIYAGPLLTHYGHFVLSSLARLWWLLRQPDRPGRIIFHAHGSPVRWFSLDYVRTIFGAAGLSADDFVYFDRPMLIRRLWVPRPCLEEMSFVHEVCGEFGTAVGRALGAGEDGRSGPTVYLSKSRLSNGVTRIADEHVIERAMSAAGLEIVHPQELPFVEQVKLFARARKIVGSVGSAFHTAMFVAQPPEILGLTMKNFVNSNYAIVDKVKRCNALYVHARQVTDGRPDDDFLNTWHFEDVEAVARELVHFV